jgi:hypothetical protein
MMTAIGARIAALMLYGVLPAGPQAASLPVQDAATKAGECVGIETSAARRLSSALQTNPDLPERRTSFVENFIVIHATATSCGVTPDTLAVLVQENTAYTATLAVRDNKANKDGTFLLVYLGPLPNGEYQFMFFFVFDDDHENAKSLIRLN